MKDAVIVLLVSILLMPLMALWRGWVASTLWAWLIVPTFAVPQMPVPTAVGAMLIIAIASHTKDTSNLEERDLWAQFSHTLIMGLLMPLFALIVGGLFSIFV